MHEIGHCNIGHTSIGILNGEYRTKRASVLVAKVRVLQLAGAPVSKIPIEGSYGGTSWGRCVGELDAEWEASLGVVYCERSLWFSVYGYEVVEDSWSTTIDADTYVVVTWNGKNGDVLSRGRVMNTTIGSSDCPRI